MEKLTDRELRRAVLAGKIARGLRYFLYLVMAGLVILAAFTLVIPSHPEPDYKDLPIQPSRLVTAPMSMEHGKII